MPKFMRSCAAVISRLQSRIVSQKTSFVPDHGESTMNIEQEKFEQIVKDVVSALEAKHVHVQTITAGAEPARFTLGFATTADALLIALSAAGIAVGFESVPSA
ncbi:hypothetical protein WK77_16585 [Burkholderia ubonensis]|nr:hypothetical protein WK77_16585 [Burkholderia ubonensis]